MDFYPRPPRGGRRDIAQQSNRTGGFLSTPSARRATRKVGADEYWDDISIHALREEGDCLVRTRPAQLVCNFYPRPPRGGRPNSVPLSNVMLLFLSTPSARRATGGEFTYSNQKKISIHALREEGDLFACADGKQLEISIHALREEGDGAGGGRRSA